MALDPFGPNDRPLWERMRTAFADLVDLLKTRPDRFCPTKNSAYCRRLRKRLVTLGEVWREAGMDGVADAWFWQRSRGEAGEQARCFLSQADALISDALTSKGPDHADRYVAGSLMAWYDGSSSRDMRAEDLDAMRAEVENFAVRLLAEAKPDAKSVLAVKKRRRRTPLREARPLTPKEVEALQLLGEHKGNYTAAAKVAGISRTALIKRYKKAIKKLPRSAAVMKKKPTTQPLPLDHRGQVNLSDEEE
jgi:predicted DNA-binding protein (UPF0251 family)